MAKETPTLEPPPSATNPPPPAEAATKGNRNKLTLITLTFLIFFEVSGGPYGSEPAVQAAGPLLAILGFVVFPFLWSLPEALVTAELSTAFPGNGGYVLWASAAFGPFPAHLMGSWKFLSGVVNAAAYPSLCSDYLSRAFPALSHAGPARATANVSFTLALSFLNYLGLAVVGVGGVALGAMALLPFAAVIGWGTAKARPARWVAGGGGKKDWGLYVNTLFWNLNYWDNASTVAGEVDGAARTYPKALALAGAMTCLGYVLPLLAATAAVDVPRESWEDGFYADAAGNRSRKDPTCSIDPVHCWMNLTVEKKTPQGMIAGNWLKYWVQVGSVLSSVGLYEAQLSSCAYQLLGMADLGFLPKVFSVRSRHFHTPWLAIVVSTAITLAMSFLSFTDIINAANFVYSLSMLLEFATFLWLRHKLPDQHRPYRVPLQLPGLFVMCLVPSVFLVLVMVLGNWKVYVIGVGLTTVGVAAYFANAKLKEKGWMEFKEEEVKAAMELADHGHGGGREV